MISPEQAGIALATGADTVRRLPQLSLTTGGVGAAASAGQSTVEVPGAGITAVGGGTVNVWEQVAVLPHASVARYVLTVLPVQPAAVTSPTKVIVTGPPQLSDAETNEISGGGKLLAH